MQKDQYLGRWQARSYRTLKGEMINGELKWVETAISTMNLKSYVARVTAVGGAHNVFGVVLNDGTPIESVEVKIDDGEWQAATLDPETMREKYGWKFFNYRLGGRHPRRAHGRLARDRRERQRASRPRKGSRTS